MVKGVYTVPYSHTSNGIPTKCCIVVSIVGVMFSMMLVMYEYCIVGIRESIHQRHVWLVLLIVLKWYT